MFHANILPTIFTEFTSISKMSAMKVSLILVIFTVFFVNTQHSPKAQKHEMKAKVETKKINEDLVDGSAKLWDGLVTKPTEQLIDWSKNAYSKVEKFNDKLYDTFLKKPAEKLKEFFNKS